MESLSGRLISGHTELVLAIDVSSDSRFIASASKDHTVRIWVEPPTALLLPFLPHEDDERR